MDPDFVMRGTSYPRTLAGKRLLMAFSQFEIEEHEKAKKKADAKK